MKQIKLPAKDWNAPALTRQEPILIRITGLLPELRGKYLKLATAAQVAREGYSFTDDPGKAWAFATEAKAIAKTRILDRHFSSSNAFETVTHSCSETR